MTPSRLSGATIEKGVRVLHRDNKEPDPFFGSGCSEVSDAFSIISFMLCR